jgi:hypothetical protein
MLISGVFKKPVSMLSSELRQQTLKHVILEHFCKPLSINDLCSPTPRKSLIVNDLRNKLTRLVAFSPLKHKRTKKTQKTFSNQRPAKNLFGEFVFILTTYTPRYSFEKRFIWGLTQGSISA